MKKWIIALFCSMLVVAVLLSGCSTEKTEKSETIHSETTQTSVGSYSLFRTQDVQEYLSFLENFDETKYEIVDISTSLYGTRSYGSDEFYIVTYKTISK